MSTNMLEKHSLPQIPEENNKTNDEDNYVLNADLKMATPFDTLRISEANTDSLPPGELNRRKSSDDGSFIISHSSHMNKPVVRFETTLSVNLYQIKEVFEKICKKRGFEIVDDEGDQVTAVNKKTANWKDLLFSCIPSSSKSYQNLTAIRLHSKTNKVTCIRRITLKALLGDMKLANAVFLDFERDLEAYNGKRAALSPRMNGTSFFTDNVLSTSMTGSKGMKYMQMRDDTHGDIDENIISTQNLESSSFYEFRKILSSDQYSIGKKVAEFLVDFAGNYKSIKESAELLPQPMESVYLLVNEVTETFFADFNYGKSETKQMMPYCKISVEKYIFDKVYSQLFAMYLAKFDKPSQKYTDKVHEINQKSDNVEQFKFLDIPQKFWLIKKDKLDENNKLIEPFEPQQIPYIDAINELSKLSKLKCPREKLGVLLMMHSLMKSAVVDFHKGKEEVCSMDEELPIMIYILLHAKMENAAAELNFVDDYVQFDPTLESEKRLMTNLRVSIQYIADEWLQN